MFRIFKPSIYPISVSANSSLLDYLDYSDDSFAETVNQTVDDSHFSDLESANVSVESTNTDAFTNNSSSEQGSVESTEVVIDGDKHCKFFEFKNVLIFLF